MKTRVLILCMLAVLLVVPAAMAQNVEAGNQSFVTVISLKNAEKYLPVPVDPNEILSQTTGTLYIAIRTAGCLDMPARQVSIANMDGKSVLHVLVTPYGKLDMRLPTGDYFVVLPVGTGSGVQPDTWQQETADITIIPGGRKDVSFIGMGIASCYGGQ